MALPDAERDRVLLRAALLIERQSKILGEDTPANVQAFLDEHADRQAAKN